MNRFGKSNRRAARPPGFFWQGVLIVLPAIVLAGFGVWSLRQDRLLVQQEAADRAHKLATILAANLLPAALSTKTLSPEAARFRVAPSVPENDPVLAYAQSRMPVIACLVNAQGDLVYPSAVAPPPEPQPLEETVLSLEQQAAWAEASRLAYTSRDFRAIIKSDEAFTALRPPERFQGLAEYHLGLFQLRNGEYEQARVRLNSVVESKTAGLAHESGYPLRTYALLGLSEVAALSRTQPWIGPHPSLILAAEAIRNPSPLSRLLLEKLAAREPAAGSGLGAYRRVWQAHEEARSFHARLLQSPLPERVSDTNATASGSALTEKST